MNYLNLLPKKTKIFLGLGLGATVLAFLANSGSNKSAADTSLNGAKNKKRSVTIAI